MGQMNTNTDVDNYQFGSGNLYFNALIDGVYQGFVAFGDCSAFTVSVTSETLKKVSFRTAQRETVKEIPLSTERTAEIACENIGANNTRLFYSGSEVTITQSATPIADEVIGPVTQNGGYQLGKTPSNPAGAYRIGSVAVRIKEGDDAPNRANTTLYTVGTAYVPATPNDHWYVCTVEGISAASPPTFTTNGSTFADGAATFKDMGLIAVASTTNINYRIDLTYAFLSVTPTGTIATANAAYAAILPGEKLSLNVDYTPVAGTRTIIKTGSSSKVEGELKYIADNTSGINRDAFFPSVSLAPNGELPFINDGEFASIGFTVGINKKDSDTDAIYSSEPLVAS